MGPTPSIATSTPDTRRFMEHFLKVFWIAGPVYFPPAEKTRYSRDNCFGDPYLRLLSLLKQLARFRIGRIGRRLVKRPYRRFIMMAVLRIHYIPIMVQQIYVNVTQLTYSLQAEGPPMTLAAIPLVCDHPGLAD